MADGDKFNLVGGHAALDFANTLDDRFNPEKTRDLLQDYEDLLLFARSAGVLKKGLAKSLRMAADEQKAWALAQARELREAMEEIFSAVAKKQPAPDRALALLNGRMKEATTHRALVQKGDGSFKWRWTDAENHVAAPLWPIACAAAELLASDDLPYVRECGCETCRWLFLDLSKNHSRRWCDMKTCGNRIKARRFYEKHQEADGRTQGPEDRSRHNVV